MKRKFYKKKLIILLGGPTASGKTRLAINLAKKINGEVINADSMQVYKNFPVLTSQPSLKEKKLIKHHLYGYIETNKSCNGSMWLKDAFYCVNKIFTSGKNPIVVGGTGLYLEFMSQGISIIPEIKTKTKSMVQEKLKAKGLSYMYYYLEKIDPEYTKKISLNDKIRITRALEVFYETKKNLSHFHKNKFTNNDYDYYKIFLSPDREQIIENTTTRFNQMIKDGLLEEFKKNKDNVKNCNISKAIGFKELNDYFLEKSSLLSLSNKIIQNTRKYAKRQYTWFNNRYYPQLKIDSYKKTSLILESLSKII